MRIAFQYLNLSKRARLFKEVLEKNVGRLAKSAKTKNFAWFLRTSSQFMAKLRYLKLSVDRL
jgi:hypothetical protein